MALKSTFAKLYWPAILAAGMSACSGGSNSTVIDDTVQEQQSNDPPAMASLEFQFEATVGSEPAECGRDYQGLGSEDATGQLADARMFLSNIQLRSESGDWVELQLNESDWQGQGIALLDFEDRSAGCSESGTVETNAAVEGMLPEGNYNAVRFDIGVPYELNHVDVSTANSPLNDPSMFWVWQGGYKFLRVDWLVDNGAVPRWNVHLGSTGCQSDNPTTAPEQACSRTNSPHVELDLPSFDPAAGEALPIALDLAELIRGGNPLENTLDTPPGCHSNPGEPDDCSAVFSSLGLQFDSGSCEGDCDQQSMFRVAD